MDIFLKNVGILAIILVIFYGYKKLLEHNDLHHPHFPENESVYQAAEAFVHGASFDEMKFVLTKCFAIDEDDAEEVLLRSIAHRADKDGGYKFFLESVNKLIRRGYLQ